MSSVVRDKFLTDLEKHQEENGMWGGKRYSASDNEKWKANQPLTEEQQMALEKRDKKGFIVLVVGVSILFFGALAFCLLQ